MHIVLPEHSEERKGELGAKTRHLATLMQRGFAVPPFVAVPTSVVDGIVGGDGTLLAAVAHEIGEALPAAQYAVRSSALGEDEQAHSFAGQFRTRLRVSPDQLGLAIREVIDDAMQKLAEKSGQFSLIIQQYIPAEFAGVTFTRNPLGGREMVVEYHAGSGDAIVSGSVAPTRLKFFWSQPLPDANLPALSHAVERWKQIETLFGFAQDIEWCVLKGKHLILQARPLTSLTTAQYAESLYLDAILPTGPFLFEKTEISEIAPRPTPITFSLLHRIYADGGPVQAAYQRLGVRFQSHNFLVVVGNELYVDREQELFTLLPAFSYFVDDSTAPRPVRLRGLLRSIRNQRVLRALEPARRFDDLWDQMAKRLNAAPHPASSLLEGLQQFFENYSFIVEVNILAAKAVRDLEAILSREDVSASAVLGGIGTTPIDMKEIPAGALPEGMRGNSLELMDASPFFQTSFDRTAVPAIEKWWEGVRSSPRRELAELTKTALRFSRLREYGRWLTVRGVHMLRQFLMQEAEVRGVPVEDVFFLTLDEWLTELPDPALREGRRSEYERYLHYTLPPRLTHVCTEETAGTPLGVSPGIVTGTLVTLETLASVKGPKILWTPVLAPELASHLDDVVGILSVQGGLLSHLAIIARERGVSVIVRVPIEQLEGGIGQKVMMDGMRGEVRFV